MHIRLIPHYLVWHYTKGIKDFLHVFRLILQAITRIFSFGLLFKTFFSPFERLGEHYNGGGISAFFEIIIVNTIMRGVGVIVRTCVLVIGLLSWIFWFLFLCSALIIWIFLPIIICLLIYMSLLNLIKAI
jgi:hypothetical protein